MAGQSDAADDLIAELAKLMAQDAQGDRAAKPAAPAAAPAQFPPVRIPGDAAPKSVSSPSTDFLRSLSTPQAPESAVEPVVSEPVSTPRRPTAAAPEPEPFQFDFGIRSADVPPAGPKDLPKAGPAPAEPAMSVPHSAEHDSIADLISAELAAHPAQEAESVVSVPVPAAAPAVMATTVAAPSPAAPAASLGSARAEHDHFRVPPVFGLGSAVAPAAATAAEPVVPGHPQASPAVAPPKPTTETSVPLDPIEEIESLIGRAMRVEFARPEDEARPAEARPAAAAPQVQRPAPSPALRSLATPVLPDRGGHELSAADQTIFAAAQATGAKVGWVSDPQAADAAPHEPMAAPRQRRAMGMSRALAGPLVAVTLLLAAGFGLYWVLGLGGRDAGPPPLLTADAAPVKEVAPVVADDGAAAPQSVVFNEMDGGTPSADEQLVSRDQTDVNEVTQVAAAATDLGDEGLANRKVRTVKVRPDGTIVSGDDSVAGSAILPVDRPNVPAVPGAETATPELLASTAPITPVEPTPAVTTPEPAIVPVEPGSTVPAVDLTGAAIAGKSATIPLQRPTGLRLASAAPAASETSAAPLAETVAPADPAPASTIPGATEVDALGDTAPAYVQLASQRSEADARQSAQNMVTRYGPLFGGANLEVQRVDLGARGIYYRVRVPASSLEQANLICTNVKAAGGDCFTM
tara:strand:+ start:4462 stop:6537 length:2076 start_codon:yes stop_codon:yes gene_type:complete